MATLAQVMSRIRPFSSQLRRPRRGPGCRREEARVLPDRPGAGCGPGSGGTAGGAALADAVGHLGDHGIAQLSPTYIRARSLQPARDMAHCACVSAVTARSTTCSKVPSISMRNTPASPSGRSRVSNWLCTMAFAHEMALPCPHPFENGTGCHPETGNSPSRCPRGSGRGTASEGRADDDAELVLALQAVGRIADPFQPGGPVRR